MVVHDKVYNCTSFVDEHPYVSSIPLTLSFSNEVPNPPNSLPNPTQNPTLAQSTTKGISHPLHHPLSEDKESKENTTLTSLSQQRW